MRVVHIVQRYAPAQLTGSEKAFVLLCETLARHTKDEIIVITSDVGPGEGFYSPLSPRINKKKEVVAGVSVYRLPVNWFVASCYYVLNRLFPFINDLTAGEFAIKAFGPQLVGLEELLEQLAPDLIHVSPMPVSHTLTTVEIAKKNQWPCIITPNMHFEDSRFNNPTIYRVLREADYIIAHTKYEKHELEKRGISERLVSVVPSSYLIEKDFTAGNGERFRRKHRFGDAPLVLFVGSKSYEKGTVHLVQAWKKVARALPDAQLVLAGIAAPSWKNYRDNVTLPDSVVEFDYLDEGEREDAVAACNLFCIPSKTESFGMVVLEAWAKAKPVIGGPTGATRELISEGESGYTVEFGDIDTLSQRIIEILSDSKLQKKLGEAGQKKARNFTEKQYLEQTLQAYAKAIKK